MRRRRRPGRELFENTETASLAMDSVEKALADEALKENIPAELGALLTGDIRIDAIELRGAGDDLEAFVAQAETPVGVRKELKVYVRVDETIGLIATSGVGESFRPEDFEPLVETFVGRMQQAAATAV